MMSCCIAATFQESGVTSFWCCTTARLYRHRCACKAGAVCQARVIVPCLVLSPNVVPL